MVLDVRNIALSNNQIPHKRCGFIVSYTINSWKQITIHYYYSYPIHLGKSICAKGKNNLSILGGHFYSEIQIVH